MRQKMARLTMLAALAFAGIAAAATTTTTTTTDADIARNLAKEIRMYSRYTIWDNVNLRVNEGNVELLGEVSQPYKKADLERLAKSVPGVASVTNELKVLPVSSFDDELRIRVARAVYGDAVLSRYAIQVVPPIHIIVRNGNVRLEGVVSNEADKNLAGIQAKGVSGVFSVSNNLRVEKQQP